MSLLQVTRKYRQRMLDLLSGAEHTITTAWQQMTATFNTQFDPVMQQYTVKQQSGEPVPLTWLYEGNKLQTIEQSVSHSVSQFADSSQQVVTHTQVQAVSLGSQSAIAQLEEVTDEPIQPHHPASLTKLVEDTSDLFNYSDTARTVKRAIISGVSLGNAASDISQQVSQALDETRSRSLTIAHTEGMNAYREGNLETLHVNEVEQWRWVAQKGSHVCPACLVMDGSLHEMSEDFLSHPNCHCSPQPCLDPNEPYQSGTEWFAAQNETTQRQILGPAKYEAWKAGKFGLEELVGRTKEGIYEKPLKQLLPTISQAKAKGGKKTTSASAGATLEPPPIHIQTAEDEQRLREMERQMAEKHPECVFDFSGADPELMEEVAKQLDLLMTKYPDVGRSLGYIGTGKRTEVPKGYEMDWKANPDSVACLVSYQGKSPAYSVMNLNPEMFSDAFRARRLMQIFALTGWSAKGSKEGGVSYLITHEFGHAVSSYLEAEGKLAHVGGTLVGDALAEFKKENDSLGKKVSDYAAAGSFTVRTEEQIAEGFASMHFAPEDQQAEYTKKLHDFLETYLPGGQAKWDPVTVGSKPWLSAFEDAYGAPFGSGSTYRVSVLGQDYFAKKLDTTSGGKELLARQLAESVGVGNRLMPSHLIESGGDTYLIQEWISNGKPLAEGSPEKYPMLFATLSPDELTRLQLFEYLADDPNRHAGNYYLDKVQGKLIETGFSSLGGADTSLNTNALLTNYLLDKQAALSVSAIGDIASQLDSMYTQVEQSGLFDELALLRFRDRIAAIQALSKKKKPTIMDLQQLAGG